MAKQSGIHQLRGKVGEHSYYRQTGVETGLVRSINQAMSNRVKTGEEYVNTRLNNAEFGQACRIAGVLGRYIIPKYRPMILPFSQSKMAKMVLEAIKSKTGSWGQRNLASSDLNVVLRAINSTHKNNPADWGLSFSINSNDQLAIAADDTLYGSKLAAIGADGVLLSVLACRPWFGNYVSGEGYAESIPNVNVYSAEMEGVERSTEVDYLFPSSPAAADPFYSMDFFVVTIMPFRIINSTQHILQEYCTFTAFANPEE